jgi:4-amino-4-deoxy-L-arabinose transferase-like glycosyltransferase
MSLARLDERAGNLLLSRRFLYLVCGLTGLLLATANLPWHLDNYDQAKQAYTSYQIVFSGDWLVQNTPRQDTATKPPLVAWISTLLFHATGWWDLAWRLPGFLACVLLLGIAYQEGLRLLAGAGGLLAVSVCFWNFLTPRLATLVRTDMVLALGVFICGWLIFRKLRSATPWSSGEKWAFGVAMLLTLFVKGPVIYAFLLPGMLAFFLLARETGNRSLVWSGWVPWVVPFLIFMVWLGAGIFSRDGFFDDVVMREFASRFRPGGHESEISQPFWFYGPHYLHKMLPWTLVLLFLFLKYEDVRLLMIRKPELLWLVCWALGGLVFMSLMPSKRVDRIFPAFFPVALLLPGLLAAVWTRPGIKTLTAAAVLMAILMWGGTYLAMVVHGYQHGASSLREFARECQTTVTERNLGTVGLLTSLDEGLILYLGKERFLGTSEALERWKQGAIRALVLPERRYEELSQQIGRHEILLRSGPLPKNESSYLLIAPKSSGQP